MGSQICIRCYNFFKDGANKPAWDCKMQIRALLKLYEDDEQTPATKAIIYILTALQEDRAATAFELRSVVGSNPNAISSAIKTVLEKIPMAYKASVGDRAAVFFQPTFARALFHAIDSGTAAKTEVRCCAADFTCTIQCLINSDFVHCQARATVQKSALDVAAAREELQAYTRACYTRAAASSSVTYLVDPGEDFALLGKNLLAVVAELAGVPVRDLADQSRPARVLMVLNILVRLADTNTRSLPVSLMLQQMLVAQCGVSASTIDLLAKFGVVSSASVATKNARVLVRDLAKKSSQPSKTDVMRSFDNADTAVYQWDGKVVVIHYIVTSAGVNQWVLWYSSAHHTYWFTLSTLRRPIDTNPRADPPRASQPIPPGTVATFAPQYSMAAARAAHAADTTAAAARARLQEHANADKVLDLTLALQPAPTNPATSTTAMSELLRNAQPPAAGATPTTYRRGEKTAAALARFNSTVSAANAYTTHRTVARLGRLGERSLQATPLRIGDRSPLGPPMPASASPQGNILPAASLRSPADTEAARSVESAASAQRALAQTLDPLRAGVQDGVDLQERSRPAVAGASVPPPPPPAPPTDVPKSVHAEDLMQRFNCKTGVNRAHMDNLETAFCVAIHASMYGLDGEPVLYALRRVLSQAASTPDITDRKIVSAIEAFSGSRHDLLTTLDALLEESQVGKGSAIDGAGSAIGPAVQTYLLDAQLFRPAVAMQQSYSRFERFVFVLGSTHTEWVFFGSATRRWMTLLLHPALHTINRKAPSDAFRVVNNKQHRSILVLHAGALQGVYQALMAEFLLSEDALPSDRRPLITPDMKNDVVITDDMRSLYQRLRAWAFKRTENDPTARVLLEYVLDEGPALIGMHFAIRNGLADLFFATMMHLYPLLFTTASLTYQECLATFVIQMEQLDPSVRELVKGVMFETLTGAPHRLEGGDGSSEAMIEIFKKTLRRAGSAGRFRRVGPTVVTTAFLRDQLLSDFVELMMAGPSTRAKSWALREEQQRKRMVDVASSVFQLCQQRNLFRANDAQPGVMINVLGDGKAIPDGPKHIKAYLGARATGEALKEEYVAARAFNRPVSLHRPQPWFVSFADAFKPPSKKKDPTSALRSVPGWQAGRRAGQGGAGWGGAGPAGRGPILD